MSKDRSNPPPGYAVWAPNAKTTRHKPPKYWDWAADGSVGMPYEGEAAAVAACWAHYDRVVAHAKKSEEA